MIRSFKCKQTRKLFYGEYSRKLPSSIQRVAFRKLRMLHQSRSLDDVRVPPGNRLELLSGVRKGQYGIRINEQWRICFIWRQGDAFRVEIVDYH
ncbi:MAG: type II toxin-antitoxin system RelE/ParE family toxin [Candidatus Sabulitectum sp.]|nr:type II toxin-antitoxin system RelE/ParE family toxin [Candidatus Sabulitectum sp.]